MCGIVGNVLAQSDRSPDADVLRRMAERITHRGPDEGGFALRGPCGLGIRRLRIIDLATGQQPMTGEDERVWVVFNGEIYNYQALTDELRARGHHFRSRSDTESIVHAYEAFGLAAFDRLEGMFGVAVWDEAARTLVLARDPVGIKPLYYAVLPDQLVFGSELKALLEHPAIQRTLDPAALAQYLMHEYVPAPRSIFRAIRKLPAGHWLTYTEGRVKIDRFWDATYPEHAHLGEADAIARVRTELDRAVRAQLVSDVPLGVFLSGGLDSSAIAAFASRHATGRLKTFAIGFEDPSFDESAHARRVAGALGTEHHEAIMSPAAALELVERVPDLIDEPLGDASLLPTFLLSRFARQSVTVALSGDGGDEIFAGYPTYQAHRVARLAGVPMLGRLARPAVERLPVSLNDLSLDFKLKRFVRGLAYPHPAERHAAWLGSFTPSELGELLTPAARAGIDGAAGYDEVRETFARVAGASWLNQILYLDLHGYLGEGVLTKVDRASMACSLEVRPPMLDRGVVELAASLPPELKLHGFSTKYVLRRALEGMVPDDILRRKKKGFGIPVGRWFLGELAPLLRDACAPDRVRAAGLFRPEVVERLIAEHRQGRHDHRKKLYTLLVFQLWADRYRPS